MTPLDQEQFLHFLSDRNKRKGGKNKELFRALLKGKEDQLKKEMGTNAFNVLKKRLTDTLSDFLSRKVFEGELSQEANVIRTLALARKLLQLNKIDSGRKLLKKAERIAQEIQHYTLLNEIYHSLIEISHEAPFEEQEALIEKLEVNSTNFLLQERLNLVFAQVKHAFIESGQGKIQIDLNELIERNFQKYRISEAKGYGLKSLYQIATIVDYAAAQSRSYHNIDLFFEEKIERLSPEEIANERNHLYHIDLLYLLANIYFRQRLFDKSLDYLKRMHEQLNSFDGKFREERIARHQMLTALNQNFKGNYNRALSILDQIDFNSKEDSLDSLQVELTKVMILAQQEKYKDASAWLRKLYRTDGYYKRIAGIEWVINRRFLEIILHIEAGNLDFAYTRIENLARQQKEFFDDSSNIQVRPFLKILKYYLNQPDSVETDAFHNFVERTIPWKPSDEDDIFFISVYAWLKAKMTQESVYDATLKLIDQRNNQS